MKLTRTKIRSLIREVLTEMDRRERNFRAAQYRWDTMEHPDFYNDVDPPSEYATEDDIFEFALEKFIDYLVDRAIDEEILIHNEETEVVLDKAGNKIGHFKGAEFVIDDEDSLVEILKSNFKEDLFKDDDMLRDYDEYMINKSDDGYYDDY